MFATFPRTRGQRRGVVLILVLGMLGLLALIGVTFATFSGQVKVNSRNFSQAQNWPDSTELMDYALAQLIDDTDNPQSAIRGHSLKRDMYGNDAYFNSALAAHPATGAALALTAVPSVAPAGTTVPDPYNAGAVIDVSGLYMFETNISANDASFYGYNFTRWILRFPSWTDTGTTPPTYRVADTHEILADNVIGGVHVFYVAPWDGSFTTPSTLPPAMTDATLGTLEMPTGYSLAPTIPYPLASAYVTTLGAGKVVPFPNGYATPEITGGVGQSTLLQGMPAAGTAFTLDGRFLHAFNGPGMSGYDAALDPLLLPANSNFSYLANRGMAQYANYRFNGNILNNTYTPSSPLATRIAYGFPNDISGMDEDYDACDLENWFLAIQSGDSQVMIPSFHRPGILIYDQTDANSSNWVDDWVDQNAFSASKILRPRAADGHSPLAFPNLYPKKNGQITYDVDNDGDGTTDSVWLDLGYPARRNSAGQLYKPLYAFMIVGLNGRIPINTAGNLQLRDLNGTSLAMHSSGKGFSPSEVDPTYALQNAYDGTSAYGQTDEAGILPVALIQLRNLLAGTRTQDASTSNGDRNYVWVNGRPWPLPNGVADTNDVGFAANAVVTATPAVAGRWGEADQMPDRLLPPYTIPTSMAPGTVNVWPNPIRAGLSGRETVTVATPPVPPVGYGDARDDNHNTFDVYPPATRGNSNYNYAAGVAITTDGEYGDYYDASGSLSLAVERLRRFVTPIDVLGDGLINNFKSPIAMLPATQTFLRGADDSARVAYVKHFRPPGMPLATSPGITLPDDGAGNLNPPGIPTTPVFYPSWPFKGWLSNVGMPSPTTPWAPVAPQSVPTDRTSNIYHGYEAYRNVDARGMVPQILLGAMQYNNSGQLTPTFDQFINSSATDVTAPITTPVLTYLPSANLNEADEMNLYESNPHDAPFGPGDLEWLYRQQDTDGASLASRLKDLAPISFTNPRDGMRRRRLVSLDSWDPTTFVWANDTPSNDPQLPRTGTFLSNSVFSTTQSASLTNLSYNLRTGSVATPVRLPSVAHRDRKINLNFPLPVSNRYDEPVRQKWIRETYQLLKAILPPKATDTPEELAQLSQYVVNLIDFRDPDCTATRFVNTDLYYASKPTWDPLTKTGKPAVVSFAPPGGVAAGAGGLLGAPWNVAGTPPPPPYSPLYDNANSPYLVQYGMEYNPVAIEEVLGFQLPRPSGTHNRLFIELVNTLTSPGAGSTACDLELNGWDFVIMPDDPTGRPDPLTGQLPIQKLPNDPPVPDRIKGLTLTNRALTGGITTDPGGLTPRLKALDSDGKANPYIFESSLPTGVTSADVENIPPPYPSGVSVKKIDLTTNGKTNLDDAVADTGNKYWWVYLRRPANPFDTVYDSSRPNENRVVVDCFRFVFNAAPSATPVNGDFYSTRRLQPFRGGHSVPPLPYSGPPGPVSNYCLTSYGYSEQTSAATDATTDTADWNGKNGGADVTKVIWHSLGKVETRSTESDNWTFFPFNDRDFTSVAELLQVPACPPGLFTKQFIESAPPIAGSKAFVTPPTPDQVADRPTPRVIGNPINDAPETFPYLADKFFYTAQPEPSQYLSDANQTGVAGGVYWPNPSGGPAPIHPTFDLTVNPIVPAGNYQYSTTYPYATFPLKAGGTTASGTAPNQYYPVDTTDATTIAATKANFIGGPSSAGWYKMFDFFDVPSPVNGSIGPVAQGSNYDWARQDLKPGLLNLNLIMDEEVFFSVMSEAWLKTLNFQLFTTGTPFPFYSPSQAQVNDMGATRLNVAQIADAATPVIVTQVLKNGMPAPSSATSQGFFNMTNQGFTALDPADPAGGYDNRMKAAFSDFLKLRHGGSGYMFAHQYGPVGSPNPAGTAPLQMAASTWTASERPFRSFSYPNVNSTLLRPAALPPTSSTVMNPWMPTFSVWDQAGLAGIPPWTTGFPAAVTKTPFKTYVGDPGVMNPYLFMANNPAQPPAIPARRLFQVPDMYGNLNLRYATPAPAVPKNPPGFPPTLPAESPTNPTAIKPSNGSSAESTFPPAWWTVNPSTVPAGIIYFTGDPNVNWQNLGPLDYSSGTGVSILTHPDVSLVAAPTVVDTAAGEVAPPTIVPNYYLGANTTGTTPTDEIDNRQHPAFRYEWLQKVTNLTTVRTHQYAVWITVGFFEVTKLGDPSLGSTGLASLSYDRLGQELNIQSGQNVRYRSFFIIDRTRAVGFSPQAPGNFRDCITYRQMIE